MHRLAGYLTTRERLKSRSRDLPEQFSVVRDYPGFAVGLNPFLSRPDLSAAGPD
jgi:hypothetical protein